MNCRFFPSLLSTCSLAVLLTVLVMSAPVGCGVGAASDTPAGKLPLPAEDRITPVYTLEELKAKIDEFNPSLGSYPVKFETKAERDETYRSWTDAYVDALAWLKSTGSAERVLWTAAELARQGHNMDVDNAGFVASGTLEKCLSLFPNSMMCHFSAAEYYSSIRVTEDSLKKLERSLTYLQKRLAPKADARVEEKLISLYAYKGEKAAAVKQIDRYLKIFPTTKKRQDLVNFRKELTDDSASG